MNRVLFQISLKTQGDCMPTFSCQVSFSLASYFVSICSYLSCFLHSLFSSFSPFYLTTRVTFVLSLVLSSYLSLMTTSSWAQSSQKSSVTLSTHSMSEIQKLPNLKAEQEEILALLNHTDDLNRGRSSQSEITLYVHNPRYQRTLKMKVWTQGTTHSLIRILSPQREAGMATLKVKDEAWNYMPNLDRILKISTSAMGGSWMGSHFTNDDLVRGSRLSEAYTWSLKTRPKGDQGNYLIYLKAKADAPVVWGGLILEINAQKVPLRMQYFNERNRLVRTLTFSDLRTVGDQIIPFKMRIEPTPKKGKPAQEWTEMTYNSLVFDVDLDRSIFSLRALKQ